MNSGGGNPDSPLDREIAVDSMYEIPILLHLSPFRTNLYQVICSPPASSPVLLL